MQTDTVSIAQFISDLGITITSIRTKSNPNMEGGQMDHWKCTMACKSHRTRMTTTYSQGYGWNGAEPKIEDVLDCLASDAASFQNSQSFEDWAADLGYDTDSRKAEKTYKAIEHSSDRLQRFLGQENYETLLWKVERS